MAKIKNITTEAVLNERLSSAIERGVTAPKAYAQAREVIKNNENIEPQLARVLNATLVMYEHVFNVVSDTAPVATDLEALRKKHEELSRYCKKHPGDTTAQSRKEELAIEIGSMVNDSGAVVLSAGVWGKDLTNKRGIRMEEQMVCPLGNDESKGDTSYPRLVEKKEEQWKKYLAYGYFPASIKRKNRVVKISV